MFWVFIITGFVWYIGSQYEKAAARRAFLEQERWDRLLGKSSEFDEY